MKLKLTTRWVEVKSRDQEIEIKEGMVIEYYGNGLDNISTGKIKKNDSGFFIDWNDLASITQIDNSENSNNILKYCGFPL